MKDKMPILTRRDFIRGTVGITLGASVFGLQWPKAEAKATAMSLVTVVRDQKAMDSAKNIDITVLEKMLVETLTRVTGQKNTKDAWLSLVKPNDVIGL
ncbi:MAG: twin-arginine translocation signal domain-containing protein, partial [Desulfobacterales bacterium]